MKNLIKIITTIQILMAMVIETESIPILLIFTVILGGNILFLFKTSNLG